MHYPSASKSRVSLKALLYGGAVTIALVMAISLGLAILAHWSTFDPFSTTRVTSIVSWIMPASTFVGGIVAGKRSRSTGWLHGFSVGLLLFLLSLWLMSSGGSEPVIWKQTFIKGFSWVAAGAVGGILGVDS